MRVRNATEELIKRMNCSQAFLDGNNIVLINSSHVLAVQTNYFSIKNYLGGVKMRPMSESPTISLEKKFKQGAVEINIWADEFKNLLKAINTIGADQIIFVVKNNQLRISSSYLDTKVEKIINWVRGNLKSKYNIQFLLDVMPIFKDTQILISLREDYPIKLDNSVYKVYLAPLVDNDINTEENIKLNLIENLCGAWIVN